MTRRLLPLVVALAATVFTAAPLSAQLLIGGQIGYLFDTKEDQFSIGADVRLPLSQAAWSVNPRVVHYLLSGGVSLNQLDANLLYTIPGQSKSRVHFYVGGGAAVVRQSFDGATKTTSETKVGLNYIAGAEFNTNSNLIPWAQTMYTAAMDYGNTYVASFGLSYRLKR
jgi:opacity protein-like surface antigen